MKRFFNVFVGLVAALSALQAQNNTLAVADISFKQGETGIVSIELNNETEFTGFQMKLKFPEGFELTTTVNEYGEEIPYIVLTDRKKSSHSVTSTILADGTISFGAISTRNVTFKGTSGAIVKVGIKATDVVTFGDYKAQLYDVIFATPDAVDYPLESVEFGLNYSDSEVSEPDEPDTPVDPDTPSDPDIPSDPENTIAANALFLEGEDGDAMLSVELDNETVFSFFQMDLLLPEGFAVATVINEDDEEVLDITLNEERKKSSHILDYNILDDGTIRVLCFTLENSTFKGTSGEIVRFRIIPTEETNFGDYMATLRNVRFSTTESVEYHLNDVQVQICYTAPSEPALPRYSVEVTTGQHGRCVIESSIVEPESSCAFADAFEEGSIIKLCFVPFDGYAAYSMKRNGELILIYNNIYEEVASENVKYSDILFQEVSTTGPKELPTPIINFEEGKVVIECDDEEDILILYAINGDPRQGNIYTKPFVVSGNVTVSAVAIRCGKVVEFDIATTDAYQSSMSSIVSRRYYREDGVETLSSENGITIVVAEYEDGTTSAYKMVKK